MAKKVLLFLFLFFLFFSPEVKAEFEFVRVKCIEKEKPLSVCVARLYGFKVIRPISNNFCLVDIDGLHRQFRFLYKKAGIISGNELDTSGKHFIIYNIQISDFEQYNYQGYTEE